MAALWLAFAPRSAHAQTRASAERVARAWERAGATVTVLPTRFLFEEDRMTIGAAAVAKEGAVCTYVALIGPRGLAFRAKLEDAPEDPLLGPEAEGRGISNGGVLELRRCHDGLALSPVPPRVQVYGAGGRGALEVVVATAPRETDGGAPLADVFSVLPERTGGRLPPMPEAGALAALAPPEKRLEMAEQRARRDGAELAPRVVLRASPEGNGGAILTLPAGCHTLEVVSRDAKGGRAHGARVDLDAELRDDERVLARDRTEAADARLDACVGERTRLRLVYAGAPPGSEVVLARGTFRLPARLPSLWGGAARSRMAQIMFTRHVAVPAEEPVYLAQGGAGATTIPLSVEIGGCYVAVAATTYGRARQLQLRTLVGARESVDERGAMQEAALSAFCVGARESARVEVVARPAGLAWGLAVYRVKSGVWEPGR